MAGTNSNAARKNNGSTRRRTASGKKSTAGKRTTTATGSKRTVKTASKKKKTASAAKRTSGSKKTAQRQYSAAAYDEIKLIIVLAVCVLLMLSIFNLCGRFGNRLAYGLFGLFGVMTYILPFALFFGMAFHMVNRRSRLAHTKIAAAVLLLLLINVLIAVNLLDKGSIETAKDGLLVSAASHTGGGFIGNLFAIPLHNGIGLIGSNVLLMALVLIAFVLMTGKGFVIWLFRQISQAALFAGGYVREFVSERADERARARAEQEEDWDDIDEGPDDETSFAVPEEKNETQVPDPDLFLADLPETEVHEDDELTVPETQETVVQTLHIEDLYEEEAPAPKHVEVPAFLRKARQNKPSSVEKTSDEEVKSAPRKLVHTLPETEIPDVSDAADIMTETRPEPETAMTADTVTEAEPVKEKTVPSAVEMAVEESVPAYEFPPIELLESGAGASRSNSETLRETAEKLQQTFDSFGIGVTVTNATCGPTVTRYELQPDTGVKVSRILGLATDIKLNLAVEEIRIEAPIPGKAAVGIEVPNKAKEMVRLRDLIESPVFRSDPSKLSFAAGKDIGGKVILGNIEKMPHLLIAGATGSGKSVCINTILISILYKADPEEVKLLMIDPKVVELSVYNDLPHLLIPVVTDPKKAAGALNWAVQAMMERYQKFAQLKTKDIKNYNKIVDSFPEPDPDHHHMPQILIVIDELADLMMAAKGEVEDAIVRLTQLARAAGIHLVIATQRPSVNVITGLIKANVPSRIAFAVSSGVDSRTILDTVGAEKLLGNGDMLFHPQGYPKAVRLQGAFVSEDEITRVTDFIKAQGRVGTYDDSITERIDANASQIGNGGTGMAGGPADAASERDVYFEEAGRFIIEKEKASIGSLQRVYKIGFNRAARIMDQLADAGVVGPEVGTKPRQILMTLEEFENYLNGN